VAQSPERSGNAVGDAVLSPVASAPVDGGAAAPDVDVPSFRVALEVFEGPFDLLLNLIGRHELDITDVALSRVTDEFIAYLRGIDTADELDQASQFLVVAATLLDLKVAGLLPQGELVDAEDVALLEARDLLFARLLQYRAFKQASAWFGGRLEAEWGRHPRIVRLEEKYRSREPELKWTLSADDFAAIAELAFAPKVIPVGELDPQHAPLVSVREQAALVVAQLRRGTPSTFRELITGADRRGVIVARFVAVLELYRFSAVAFEQLEPLGELTIRWVADAWSDENLANLGADYG
jgi:segregation and condensation protein A